MGIAERKEREKKELRGRILEATAHILMEEGYEKTTIRKVAEAIEYSPRTVYLYFKDKDSLLMEIIEDGFGATLEKRSALQETLDYSKPEQVLGVQIRNNIQTALSSPKLYRAVIYLLQFKAYPPGPNQLEVMEMVRRDMEACVGYQGKTIPDAGQKAELLFAFLRGFNLMLINKIENISEVEVEDYIQQCLEVVLKGIVGIKV